MFKTIIFPCDYFEKRKVDMELSQEYNSALANGFEVILFDYNEFIESNRLNLSCSCTEERFAIYRGFMMKPELYEIFYNKLSDKNIFLINKPKEYEYAHIFPNVYKDIKSDTANTIIFDNIESADIKEIHFKKFMVKDYVKSVKGTNFPKYFDNTLSQVEFENYIRKFVDLRGNLFTGGICVKEYLSLKYYGNYTNEYRVFYANGREVSISRNSGQGIYTPLPPQKLVEKYSKLSSNFYTIDYAELENGQWKILEAGDGQVSGLSDFQDYYTFYSQLLRL